MAFGGSVEKVLDAEDNQIGLFDGEYIRGESGQILYWLDGDDVLAPSLYADEDLKHFEKGQFRSIGKIEGTQCVVDGDILFRISS